MTDRELMQMALEVLEEVEQVYGSPSEWFNERLQALRTALAQPVPEPTQEIYAVLFAVEEAVRNGCAPWDIEAAFEKYEAKVKEIK